MQNPGKLRTRGVFRNLVYSEPWHIRTLESFAKMFNILYEINIMSFFNTGVIFTPIAVILFKKSMETQGAGGHDFWYTLN